MVEMNPWIEAAVPAGPEAVLRLWVQGLRAIELVHNQGACLSQAFARNLVRCPDGVLGFIDFEEDPLEVMDLDQAQARDWLMFAFGMAKYYDGRTDVLADMLSRVMRREPEVAAHAGRVGRLKGFAQRIAWLRAAHFNRAGDDMRAKPREFGVDF